MSEHTTISALRDPDNPIVRRERRLERSNVLLSVLVLILIAGYITYTSIDSLRPRSPVVVDYETGELKGEYRTTSFRTQTEMVTGGVRFADHFYSMNSNRVRQDQYIAMMMMSDKLREARMKYLEETDLIRKLESANSSSHVEYSEKNILSEKGEYMKLELIGNIVLAGLEKNRVPFHLILDLRMAEITDKNTSGVKVVAYRDF